MNADLPSLLTTWQTEAMGRLPFTYKDLIPFVEPLMDHPRDVDLDPIYEVAYARGIAVVEDAAHALPASYKGRRIGSGSNPVAFSFYATKNLTTAEGGMLTGEPDLIERARVLSLHGMSRDAWKRYDKGGSWYYEVVAPGFKYKW